MQSVSASYFKTIKQLICCDNHSQLCHLDYFDFECFRVKVFYKICYHGYQIIESFRLPFVFSRRAFATILNATTFILLPSKCQSLYLGLGGQQQNTCFVVFWEDRATILALLWMQNSVWSKISITIFSRQQQLFWQQLSCSKLAINPNYVRMDTM